MRFQVEFQPRVRGVRHHSDVGPGCTNVEEVYHIFDKVLNLLEVITAYATGTVQNERQINRRLANCEKKAVREFKTFSLWSFSS